jgi:Glu-tRNA(Gln) amidotransferase subunit E-like FAD-binding protein
MHEKALKLYKDVNEELEKATQELIAPNHNKNVLDYYAKIAKSIVNIIKTIDDKIQPNREIYTERFIKMIDTLSNISKTKREETLDGVSTSVHTLQDVSEYKNNYNLNEISQKEVENNINNVAKQWQSGNQEAEKENVNDEK